MALPTIFVKAKNAYKKAKEVKRVKDASEAISEGVKKYSPVIITSLALAPFIFFLVVIIAIVAVGQTVFTMFGAIETPTASASSNSLSAVVNEARGALGVPYVWGGTSYEDGMDCSGLVVVCYERALGVSLPHNTGYIFQSDLFEHVDSVDELVAGDLIQFGGSGMAGHIGIYTGEGTVIEEPGWNVPGYGNVCVETDLNDFLSSSSYSGPYFLHYVG